MYLKTEKGGVSSDTTTNKTKIENQGKKKQKIKSSG
jgi:hypothetical protein